MFTLNLLILHTQSVLTMMGNEVIRHISNYRKTLICDIVSLTSHHNDVIDNSHPPIS